MKRSWLLAILTFIVLFAGVQFANAALSVLTGPQGGTGIGSATTSQVGYALVVSSTSPTSLYYKLAPISGGGGSGSVSGTGTAPYFPYWINSSTLSSTSSFYQATSTGYIGLNTTTPGVFFTIDGDGGIFANGLTSLVFGDSGPVITPDGAVLPYTGAGDKMFWYPRKAALRAGIISTTTPDAWDDANIGYGSMGFGADCKASGPVSFCAGALNVASGNNAFVVGGQNSVSGQNANAGGSQNSVSGEGASAYGEQNTCSGRATFCAGLDNSAVSAGAIVFGDANYAAGGSNFVAGSTNSTSAFASTVTGAFNTSQGRSSLTTGENNTILAGGTDAVIFGAHGTVGGAQSVLFNMSGTNDLEQSTTTAFMGGHVGFNTTTPQYDLVANTGQVQFYSGTNVSGYNWKSQTTDGVGGWSVDNSSQLGANNAFTGQNNFSNSNTFATTTINGELNLAWGTPSTTACGTGSSITGTNHYGTVTVGSGVSVTACTLTFSPAFAHTAVCTADGINTFTSFDITAQSTSSVTFGLSVSLAGGQFNYHCF